VNDRITGCAAAGSFLVSLLSSFLVSFLISFLVLFLVVFAAADGTQANLLTPQPDLNLIAGLQIQQGGIKALPISGLPLP
jgi:hypothetical protein